MSYIPQVFHLTWAPEGCHLESAIKPLIKQLDAQLVDYHRWLLPHIFVRLLVLQFRAVLHEVKTTISDNPGVRGSANVLERTWTDPFSSTLRFTSAWPAPFPCWSSTFTQTARACLWAVFRATKFTRCPALQKPIVSEGTVYLGPDGLVATKPIVNSSIDRALLWKSGQHPGLRFI